MNSLSKAVSSSTAAELSIAQKPIGRCDAYLSDGAPSSIAESRTLVAQAYAEMDKCVGSHNWESPAEFPTIIQEWFLQSTKVLMR